MNKMKFISSCALSLLIFVHVQLCYATKPAQQITSLPGDIQFSAALQQQLQDAVQKKGANYRPRTSHLHADGSAKYTNRLILEPSPYLQQHAHNPVNWYAWGEQAFAQAQALNRPVLLSIGYSTCHWCHVMEEESYDNPKIAAYINKYFIAIKVDRESRPDIDAIYMRAVQTMTGHGGWPLNVWLLPDKQAFFGGTYFPPQDQQGRKGLLTVLRTVHEVYHQESAKINKYAKQLTAAIQSDVSTEVDTKMGFGQRNMQLTTAYFKQNIDPFSGGVGDDVKFPSSTPMRLLLRQYQHQRDEQLLEKLVLTLDKMADGGIYDQLAGGFHRYSTDPQWRIPHFEKMLYDNALLALDYLEAYQLTKDPDYQRIVVETLDYVQREMRSGTGGFYSATDADSLNAKQELQEGWCFTWTVEELQNTVNMAELPIVSAWFGFTQHGELDGRNVLYRPYEAEQFALQHYMQTAQLDTLLAKAKDSMLKARLKRPQALRDDKIITAWNGLMIATFAQAGFVLNRADYILVAQQAADFILSTMMKKQRLQRIYLNGKTQGPAFLNDYAFLINALIQLYQADTQQRWLQMAIQLQKLQDTWYLDTQDGLFFNTAKDAEKLLYRDKPAQDGVIPSGNSIAAYNLLRLYKLTTQVAYYEQAMRMLQALKPRMDEHPLAMTELLIANDFALSNGKEVVLLVAEHADNTQAMLTVLREQYIPEHVYLVVKDEELKNKVPDSPLFKQKRTIKGQTTAYVCKDKVCQLPTTDPDIFFRQLQ